MTDLERSEYVSENRERFSHYAARQRDNLKLEMIAAYGGKCKRCDEGDPDVLVLDHVNDDSFVEKEKYGENARGGHKHYSRLKRDNWPQDRFQLLCYNCNAKKEIKRRREGMITRNGVRQLIDKSRAHANVPPPSHNVSGIKGVFWNSQKSKWQAKLMLNYKNVHLGFFEDIGDAARAYAVKAKEIWGDMARVATEEEINAARELQMKPAVATKNATELGL